MKRTAIIISAIIAAAVAAWAVRQAVAGRRPTFDTHRMEKVDKAVLRAIDDGQTAGAVLCVVKRADDGESMGEILYLKAYGNMQVCSGCDAVSGELNADTVAMPVDAVFDLASVSKCLGTTLAFMRLVEDGLVRLDDNVSRYIPGFEPWVEDLSPKEQRRQKRKPERIPITVASGVLLHNSRIYVQKRLPKDVWGGLWEFPGGGIEEGERPAETVVREFFEETGFRVRILAKLATIKHAYTKYHVTLHCFALELASKPESSPCDCDFPAPPRLSEASDYRWLTLKELEGYAMPSAHRKLANSLHIVDGTLQTRPKANLPQLPLD